MTKTQPTTAPTPAESAPQSAPAQGETGFPNIEAIASGTISGRFSEWPLVKPEAARLLRELNAAKAELERREHGSTGWEWRAEIMKLLVALGIKECGWHESFTFGWGGPFEFIAGTFRERDTLRAQVAQLTGAQDRMDAEIAMLTADLFRATSERDQARQDLEERCAENDRERAAHLQAYQEACKERDEAREELPKEAFASNVAILELQSKLNAVERERDALQVLRDEDRQLWTQKLDEVVSEKRTAVELVRLLDERNGLLHQLRSVLREAGFPDRIKMGEDFHGNEDWAPVRVECQLKDALTRLTAAESELAELRKFEAYVQKFGDYRKAYGAALSKSAQGEGEKK